MAIPLCPYFTQCGGCTAQHIDYDLQVENKKKYLQQITKKEDIQVFSDKKYHYRNRMDLIFHKNGLGLRKKGHWDKIIPIEQCVIAEEKINILMREIQQTFTNCDAFDLRKHSGTFRYAVIRSTPEDSSISFVLNKNSTRIAEAIEQIKHFAQKSTAKNILVTYVAAQTDMSISSDYICIKGKDFLQTSYHKKNFFYPIQGFFQNNHSMAEKMQGYVTDIIKKFKTKDALLLDLYGGVGTFGIMNAEYYKEVLSIESVTESIETAKKNSEENKCSNVSAMLLDAKQISRLQLKKPLFVITDPPRTGMDQKTIAVLNQEQPECIIYISCNPQQLAKDLPKFKDYEIQSVALFDLFPQTPHSEAIIGLTKKKP
ncbi:MAG TPA: 23S rRNA (uracil(1939)-C(5))-methyltransferase RlmD [Nanoarchaeota archaeon]|nr:23S rRNA (uracil(1939)-C(5))-methyltransferase RlmD [Candidatus Woesearchaeota archaeon]HIH14936.1 23S rRNA (uracil(1939)-C(5))-methyltransferase RlmD [Nanoarchaeota archaeon]HIH58415.1 23S rRNA (uracil(1939)-C(5))-methyltransferase RlmD [Nanoarchaeota archaeon]HIJ05640.1 23S rRNA (uracil(1939)-C(5))-methyltransferase RlmD [Nanoarchaeota archaeon]